MKTTKERILGLKIAIGNLGSKIKYLQDNCPHTNKISTPMADTGNYDPSQDCYWVVHQCPDCLNVWQEDK